MSTAETMQVCLDTMVLIFVILTPVESDIQLLELARPFFYAWSFSLSESRQWRPLVDLQFPAETTLKLFALDCNVPCAKRSLTRDCWWQALEPHSRSYKRPIFARRLRTIGRNFFYLAVDCWYLMQSMTKSCNRSRVLVNVRLNFSVFGALENVT